MNVTTFIRGLEAFIVVLVSAFLTQITVDGKPIDLSQAESQSRLLTALLAAFAIAFRQWTATRPAS